MKQNFHKRKFTIFGIVASITIVIWATTVLVMLDSNKKNEQAFLNAELRKFDGQVQSILKTYESFSNYIYDDLNQDEEILSTMHQANGATIDEKDTLRKTLFEHMDTKYETMTKYKFRQLHFHLLNTESFLRMHSPEKYGDLLMNARESVRLANETKEYMIGFEEGKVINDFRYVYPLHYQEDFIGTVELSISGASILEVLSKLYPEEDFNFLIKKSVVDEKVFDSKKNNYIDSTISNDHYMDKEVKKTIDIYTNTVPKSEKSFIEGLKKTLSNKLDENNFSTIYRYNDMDYIVNSISIKNFEDEAVGNLLSIAETQDYKRFSKDLYTQIFLITFLAVSIVCFGLIVTRYQSILKNASERDYVTKLYNRHKLYDIANKEIKRSKRFGYSLSVVMMDIDHFKYINDTYGHDWGDQVLKELATLISNNIRTRDVFARWGGEEFLLLLPHANEESILQMAEKIRTLVDEATTEKLQNVTVSMGVARIDPQNYDIDSAINLADEALYRAKENGRNQVCN